MGQACFADDPLKVLGDSIWQYWPTVRTGEHISGGLPGIPKGQLRLNLFTPDVMEEPYSP